MADDSDLEKTEQASPQRLDKAREEGQVARSRELTTCLMLFAGVGSLWALGSWLYRNLSSVMQQSMSIAWNPKADLGDAREMTQFLVAQVFDVATPLLLFFLILIVVAILSGVALGGLVFSSKALAPQFGRMNLFKGVGRMVSGNTWVELIKTLLKATLIGAVAALAIQYYLPQMLDLGKGSVQDGLARGINIVALTCLIVVSSLLIIALIDVPWQMFSHAKKMRMSKEEVKREHKESEGDPHVKGRIRQQQREAARRRMISEIPSADVIITNPTHYAVAIKYEQDADKPPTVVAKGQNKLALKIREIAKEHHVPTLEAPPLARALYANTEIGQEIPEKLYTAVAQVLAWVYQLKLAQQRLAPTPATPDRIEVPAELDPQTEKHTNSLDTN